MSKVKFKICSKCGAQMQIEEGVMTTSIPPMYRYHCPVCGGLEFDTEKYPVPEIVDDIRNYRPFQARVDWDAFRREAAKAAMQGILASGDDGWSLTLAEGYKPEEKHSYPIGIARFAIACADELIRQLNEKR